ncbi:MAG TPA: sigma-70 family RNA polymerase sigma factor [Candidatus Binatia bacterium]|nr:sigma-70 family RNA polymerase sigma factor [Candidatus Binatia bacterium]
MRQLARAGTAESRAEQDRERERALVEAAQKDRRRFAPLYEANFAVVYAYLARRVRERADVEDLTAEVFRKAIGGLDGFDWRGAPFAAWLLRIAANTLTDRARRALRAVPPAPAAASEREHVDRDAVEQAELFRLVAELPADQRRVIELRFAHERSIREIALALDRSEGAVKQLQLRALQSLRKKMSRNDG